MNDKIIKTIRINPETVAQLKRKSNALGMTQGELINFAIKSISEDAIEKIRQARELVTA
jgi:uncharacterized protein YlzI (FlbEa/FlbD family)